MTSNWAGAFVVLFLTGLLDNHLAEAVHLAHYPEFETLKNWVWYIGIAWAIAVLFRKNA